MGNNSVKWARSDEHLLEIITRKGARPRDVELNTETRDQVPFKTRLEDAYAKSNRQGRFPLILLDYETTTGNTKTLGLTLMRLWAQTKPVKSIIQFTRQWHIVGHQWGRQVPLGEDWERAHSMALRNDKKWGVAGVRPKTSQTDGVVCTDYSWYVADREFVKDREKRLKREDKRLERQQK